MNIKKVNHQLKLLGEQFQLKFHEGDMTAYGKWESDKDVANFLLTSSLIKLLITKQFSRLHTLASFSEHQRVGVKVQLHFTKHDFKPR